MLPEIFKNIEKNRPIGNIIVEVAKIFVGEKEIPGNKGFYNKTLHKLMSPFWGVGDPWCADFMTMVWMQAYAIKYGTGTPENDYFLKQIRKLFSPNSQRLFNNFKKSNMFNTGDVPVVGAGYVWAYTNNGKLTIHGHTGTSVVSITGSKTIVLKDGTKKTYYSWSGIEGNAKDKVSIMERNTTPEKGKMLLGFIYPRDYTQNEINTRYTKFRSE